MLPAKSLAASLKALGVPTRRFKTGTPSRVNRRSVDFSKLEPQYGDEGIIPFSFDNKVPIKNKELCYITYTNERTKQVILENIHRSPLYSGKIDGVGPRYCPSIEDKIVRFAEKERHQVFIEPCGTETEELYLQGLSSSLPEDVQLKFLHSIPGLENCRVMRTAYAIEYDCVDPLALRPTLEFLDFEGLFGAGQFNGSSGYEEAAAQGLVAGINAANKVKGLKPLILDRASSYIGTLIDDLVTKGCSDPYRMMTSRSEYRLILRQDNADRRLTETGYKIGLIPEERYLRFLKKLEQIKTEQERVQKEVLSPSEDLNRMLVSRETTPVDTGVRLEELLRRPQINYEALSPFDLSRPDLAKEIFEQVEIDLKYEGYIKRQQAQIDEMRRLEGRPLDENIDYRRIHGLRLEAKEKLKKIRPVNVVNLVMPRRFLALFAGFGDQALPVSAILSPSKFVTPFAAARLSHAVGDPASIARSIVCSAYYDRFYSDTLAHRLSASGAESRFRAQPTTALGAEARPSLSVPAERQRALRPYAADRRTRQRRPCAAATVGDPARRRNQPRLPFRGQ